MRLVQSDRCATERGGQAWCNFGSQSVGLIDRLDYGGKRDISMILGFLARGEWWCYSLRWKRLGGEGGIEKVSGRK